MRSLILIVAILSLLSGVRGIQTHKRNLMNLARRQQVQANSTDIDTIFNRLKSIQDGFPSNGFTPPFLVFNSFKANDTNILPPDSAFKNGQIKGVDDEICKNSPKSSDTKSQNEGVTFYCVNFVHFERCNGGKIVKNFFRPAFDNPFHRGCVGGGFCLGGASVKKRVNGGGLSSDPCQPLTRENLQRALDNKVFHQPADSSGN